MSKRMIKLMGTGAALRWRIVTVLMMTALLPLPLVGIGSWVVSRPGAGAAVVGATANGQ